MVLGVEHHRLAAAQAEHGLAHLARRGALADLDAEGVGQLGVPDRGAEVAEGELEGGVEHDEAAGIRLKRLVR